MFRSQWRKLDQLDGKLCDWSAVFTLKADASPDAPPKCDFCCEPSPVAMLWRTQETVPFRETHSSFRYSFERRMYCCVLCWQSSDMQRILDHLTSSWTLHWDKEWWFPPPVASRHASRHATIPLLTQQPPNPKKKRSRSMTSLSTGSSSSSSSVFPPARPLASSSLPALPTLRSEPHDVIEPLGPDPPSMPTLVVGFGASTVAVCAHRFFAKDPSWFGSTCVALLSFGCGSATYQWLWRRFVSSAAIE